MAKGAAQATGEQLPVPLLHLEVAFLVGRLVPDPVRQDEQDAKHTLGIGGSTNPEQSIQPMARFHQQSIQPNSSMVISHVYGMKCLAHALPYKP